MAAPARDRKSLLTFEHCAIPFPRNLYLFGPPSRCSPSIDDASVSAASASRFEKDRAHSLDFPEVPSPTFDADRRPRDNGSVETNTRAPVGAFSGGRPCAGVTENAS